MTTIEDTNPLIAVLTATGWNIHRDSVLPDSYYLSHPLHDTILFVGPSRLDDPISFHEVGVLP